MIFQSFDFLIFFVGLLVLYWTIPHRARNPLLLVASYMFYGYVHLWLLLLLAGYTLVTYATTRAFGRYPERKRPILWFGIASALIVLGVFKYFGFFVDSFGEVLEGIGLSRFDRGLNIFLPIGISFYAFQTIGYIIDVYQGRTRARTKLIDVALFVSFFPQLVAGPIERASRMFPQIQARRSLSPDGAITGVTIILWGFFKKLVIADNVAWFVNRIFAAQEPNFFLIWVAVIGFAVQIYADFSGYTDIARGTAKLFGFDLSQNFRAPYFARSPVDFWRRWHITLSTWFRDYVYIPLGGARRSYAVNFLVLLVTFALSGLWHGANWNFVLWGLYHGLAIQGTRIAGRYSYLFTGRIGTVFTYLATTVVITFGWLLFREQDLGHIFKILSLSPFNASLEELQVALFILVQMFVFSLPILVVHVYETRPRTIVAHFEDRVTQLARPMLGAAMVLSILVMAPEPTTDFIYFQF